MIEIKKIFPQCKSILLLFERQCTEETLRRNGFAFDEMICLGESNPKKGSATGVNVSRESLLRLPITDYRFSMIDEGSKDLRDVRDLRDLREVE